MPDFPLLLAIDTCGPSGSVALGRIPGRDLEILGQTELAGRTYSATLISAVAELAAFRRSRTPQPRRHRRRERSWKLYRRARGRERRKGPRPGRWNSSGGDFAARSSLAQIGRPFGSPRCASRRSVLAFGAHRPSPVELLAGPEELAAVQPAPTRVAVCDESAAALLARVWPQTQIVNTPAPLASDALRPGEARLIAGAAVDLALLDGHYLRRSDAEIFGSDVAAKSDAAAPAAADPVIPESKGA